MSSSNIQTVTKTGAFTNVAISGRTRVVGVYYTCNNTASVIHLHNNTTGAGTAQTSIYTPGAAGAYDIIVPDMGILFTEAVYLECSANVLSVTLLFYGGAAA
ncbi:hypothetical protein UFOVP652_66 [uncultured Caudovirales phage]|uniref:Uncharacterized protein n=1 Tax=uncultured Caudovirales phage TaxID=2100421 RepID=A0A6J7X7D7_9CAUD|nr:hypothetical protein UFOVP652_66 [uncultured Caudovirales phage]CAB5224358.1 hypothetical protein UFOVP734_58 [uncultured Caudovirales phage]